MSLLRSIIPKRALLRSLAPLLVALAFALPPDAVAQAHFVTPGSFVVLTPCRAYDSIRTERAPVDLDVDGTYVAYGENKEVGASHVHIGIGDARKWVALDCGDYQGEKPPFRGQGGGGRPPECLPFFDDLDNPVPVGVGGPADITPPAPPIEPFGHAVNQVCAEPGTRTSPTDFKDLLGRHPEVLAHLMAFTGGRVFADRPPHQDKDAYLEDLAEAWYAIHGFDHIFCGEPDGPTKIGGLHYHGRYQQLQADGAACRLPNFGRNEVLEGSIYTMGVRMARPGGGWAEFPVKGYGLTMSAADMLAIVTRAFAENPTDSSESTGCILDVNDQGTPYRSVFVRRASGIRTFYPDATPDLGRNPPCARPVVLAAAGGDGDDTQPDGGEGAARSLTAGGFRIEVIGVDDDGVSLRISRDLEP